MGHRTEVCGLQSLGRACWTGLGSRGRPTGLASSAKANTGNAKQTSTSGYLICSGWQGALPPQLGPWAALAAGREQWPPCSGDAQSRGRPHRPSAAALLEEPGKHSGGQQAARGARRYPGRRPPGCCWDPVSCSRSSEESCKGSAPPPSPRKEPGGQTVVNAAAAGHRGDQAALTGLTAGRGRACQPGRRAVEEPGREQRVLQPLALIQLAGALTLPLNNFLSAAGRGQNCGGGVGGGQR